MGWYITSTDEEIGGLRVFYLTLRFEDFLQANILANTLKQASEDARAEGDDYNAWLLDALAEQVVAQIRELPEE